MVLKISKVTRMPWVKGSTQEMNTLHYKLVSKEGPSCRPLVDKICSQCPTVYIFNSLEAFVKHRNVIILLLWCLEKYSLVNSKNYMKKHVLVL